MEKRDWQYWQKKMAEWKAAGTEPTEDELAEMLQCDLPSLTPEEKAHIKQFGTQKQKQTLAQEEYLRVQRDITKRAFFEQQGKKQKQ